MPVIPTVDETGSLGLTESNGPYDTSIYVNGESALASGMTARVTFSERSIDPNSGDGFSTVPARSRGYEFGTDGIVRKTVRENGAIITEAVPVDATELSLLARELDLLQEYNAQESAQTTP